MKIGIMGGTFDPVHLGHLEMALFCLEKFKLDKIMFLPLGDAPHKSDVSPKEVRVKMLQVATEKLDNCFISLLEVNRKGKTYTFDTLSQLKSTTDDEYFYIIGGDTLNTLHKWYRAEDVFKLVDFIVVDREESDVSQSIDKLKKAGAKFIFADHLGLNISSSDIRRKIAMGKDVSDCVSKEVLSIINEHKLYSN